MKLLVVEAHPGLSEVVCEQLSELGHRVEMCADGDSPCRSVDHPAECPLKGHVDLTIVVRPAGAQDTLLEMGAVCAERHRVPVLRIDPTSISNLNDVVRVAAASGKDRREAAYAHVVRAALRDQVDVEVEHTPGRIVVTLAMRGSDNISAGVLADRARSAVRHYDEFVRTIDVSVRAEPAT